MNQQTRCGMTFRIEMAAAPSQERQSVCVIESDADATFIGFISLPASALIDTELLGLDGSAPFPDAIGFATDPAGTFSAGGSAEGDDELGAITLALEFDRGSGSGSSGGGPTTAAAVSYDGAYATVQAALDAIIAGGAAANSAFITMTASIDLSGHRVVFADGDGDAAYPSTANLANGQALVGVTTGAISHDADGQVQIAGLMIESSWAWIPGPIYCADSGVLTQTPPTGKWVRQVAVAIGATAIIISLQAIISTP